MAGADVEFRVDEAAIRRLLESPAGPVGDYLAGIGRRVYTEARRIAPVSPHGSHGRQPGYLQSRIKWALGRDSRGLYAEVASMARTSDGRGFPYGHAQELETLHGRGGHRIKTTPHLVPALESIIGSL